MNFLEKDLENIIWESDNEKLQERNLPIMGKKFRQFKIGSYGILDLMTVRRKYYYDYDLETYLPYLDITIYELKKEKVGISAFLQAIRYCKGIKTYFESKKPEIEFALNVVLVGKQVDTNSDFIFLLDLIDFQESGNANGLIKRLKAYSFDYHIDGIKFKCHEGYDLIEKGF